MLNKGDIGAEQGLDRNEKGQAVPATTPRFLADALAWMEIQRAGLARLQQYQREEAVEALSDVAGLRAL